MMALSRGRRWRQVSEEQAAAPLPGEPEQGVAVLSVLNLLVRCLHAVLSGVTQGTGAPRPGLDVAAAVQQVSRLMLRWGSGVGALAGSGRAWTQRGASLEEMRHRVARAAVGLAQELENASRQDHREALAYLATLDETLAADLDELLHRGASRFETLLLGIPEVASEDQMATYFDQLATKADLLNQGHEVLLRLSGDLGSSRTD